MSTSDWFLKDRIAEITLETMQRIAVRAVMTLKNLQVTSKGSTLLLGLVICEEDDDDDDAAGASAGAPSPFLSISSDFLSSNEFPRIYISD